MEPDSEMAKEMFETVTKKLLNNYGLKTLAKGEAFYKDVYEGDVLKRDMSYHQGITWPWLLGVYADGFKNIIKAEKNETQKSKLKQEYESFAKNVEETFRYLTGEILKIYKNKEGHTGGVTLNGKDDKEHQGCCK